MKYCPNCGAEVPRPTQKDIENLEKTFDEMERRMKSSFDPSKEGLASSTKYIDVVLKNIMGFQKEFLRFIEFHQETKRDKQTFEHPKTIENLGVSLARLLLISTSFSVEGITS